MERLSQIVVLAALALVGCATSVPVDCPAGFVLTLDAKDCEPAPTSHMPDAGPPDSGLSCEEVDCADENECTEDGCAEDACVHAPVADGTACTYQSGAGLCQTGECVVDCTIVDCRPVYACTEQGLRDAIRDGGDLIIGCTAPTTVTLTEGRILIDADIVLDGLGNLTVDGNGDDGVFAVNSTKTAELIGVGITGGSRPEGGGAGIFVGKGGFLTLRGCILFGNTAYDGGALSISGGDPAQEAGSATIIDSEIRDNVALRHGGGIVNGGDLTVVNSSISGNTAQGKAAGIWNTSIRAMATLEHSLIDGNRAEDSGGGVWSSGFITLDDCVLSNNQAGTLGGAIRVSGEGDVRTQNGTLITNNRAGSGGGGIANANRVTLVQTTVTKNSARTGNGGGMENAGEASVTDSIFAENAAKYGGGMYTAGGRADIARSSFSNNAASSSGGGIRNASSEVNVTDSIVSENTATHGGGMYTAGGPVGILRSTFYSNAAEFGGGIRVSTRAVAAYELALLNSTLSGNSAGTFGGGLAINDAAVLLVHSTLYGNNAPTGSGVYQQGAASCEAGYSVIHGGCAAIEDSVFESQGPNALLILEAEQCLFSGSSGDLALTAEEMNLGELADNGGLAPTHKPNPGSLLIDAVPVEQCDIDVGTDQRGEPRGVLDACDLGSVEIQPGG